MGARLRRVDFATGHRLEEYRLVDGQDALVDPLIAKAHALADRLNGSRIWMLSSTSTGGGVAATLPHTCGKLRELGLDVRWLVLEPDDDTFFPLTKRLHHLLHGRGSPEGFAASAQATFARVSGEGARALKEHLEVGDVVVVHDPQPCGIAALLPEPLRRRLVWRCHIGVPFKNEGTEAAWTFLRPWLEPYARMVFTSARYVPAAYKDLTTAMQPTIDPLSHKNRPLSPYKLLGILRASGLAPGDVPDWARFEAQSEQYVGGRFAPVPIDALLSAPIVLHVSRFDPLKGFECSLAAFDAVVATGAERARRLRASSARAFDELSRCRLVLAGPDPSGVSDDPEATAVLADLCRRRDALPPATAERVHIVRLPMTRAKQNALMVNALQRIASVIVQPSIQEGFGLTVTEALYKAVPVVGTNVGGIAQQIRADVDGKIIDRADDVDAFAAAVTETLVLVKEAERMARSGRRRVRDHFLLLREVIHWVDLIAALVASG